MQKLIVFFAMIIAYPLLAHDTVTETHVVTHHDNIPRFAIEPEKTAVKDGLWSDPTVWGGSVPDCDPESSTPLNHVGDDILIPSGINVIYDMKAATHLGSIEVFGTLTFATDMPTCIYCETIMVMPGGRIEIGTIESPATAEIVFYKDAFDYEVDPSQYGCGLIVFGEWSAVGQSKTSYARAGGDIAAGSTSASMDRDVSDWVLGDTLVVPHTSQHIYRPSALTNYTSKSEVVLCAGGSSWDSPLTNSHLGSPPNPFGIDVYPHIANLSRSIVLRSENPASIRGHVMVTGGGTANIASVEFRSMGRTRGDIRLNSTSGSTIGTNQVARYPLHFHHSHMAGNSTTNCTFRDNLKWAVAIHGTSNVVFDDNVIYDTQGSGLMTEDGSETGCEITNNLVIYTHDGFQRDDTRAGITIVSQSPRVVEAGADSSAFWFRGGANTVTGNFAYDCQGYAYNYNGYYRDESLSGGNNPITLFEGNEACACKGAIWLTWSQGVNENDIDNYYIPQTVGETLGWNCHAFGVHSYHEANTTYQDLTFIFDPAVSNLNKGSTTVVPFRCSTGIMLGNAHYENRQVSVTRCKISEANLGVFTPKDLGAGFVFTDSTLANQLNVIVPPLSAPLTTITDVVELPSNVSGVPLGN